MEPSSFASATQQEQKRLPCNRAGSDQEIRISEFFVDKEKLHYKGLVVQRLRKRIKIDEGQQTFITANASYVVLRRHGTTVRKFDGISHPWGNGADFGLFALLGGESKQLIVSLDVFRGGSQWVVELSKSAHVIYDGRAWGTGRESDDMGIVDLDNDGVCEITVPITDFYEFQDKLPIARIPLPEIVFKYDPRAKKYLPANPLFQDYLLDSFKGETQHLTPPDDRFGHLADIMSIVLDLIFAGKETEAWAFFDHSYQLPDKKEISARMRTTLLHNQVYRFIYRRGSARRRK